MSEDPVSIRVALASLISIAMIWIGWYWLFRAYWADRLRDNLFLLRDELVELVASGSIKNDDPVYLMLRASINGSIRMAHRVSTYSFFLMGRVHRRPEVKAQIAEFSQHWEASIQRLPKATQERVNDIRGRLHYLCFEKALKSSILFWLLVLPVVVWVLLYEMSGALPKLARKWLGPERVNRISAKADYICTVAAG